MAERERWRGKGRRGRENFKWQRQMEKEAGFVQNV